MLITHIYIYYIAIGICLEKEKFLKTMYFMPQFIPFGVQVTSVDAIPSQVGQ